MADALDTKTFWFDGKFKVSNAYAGKSAMLGLPRKIRTALIWTFLVITLVVLIWISCEIRESCSLATVQAMISFSNSLGCTEFWLNRYQTFLIGALALAAATFAGWAAFRQMKEAGRQSSLLVRSAIQQRISALHAERDSEFYRSIKPVLELYCQIPYGAANNEWADQLSIIREKIELFALINPSGRRVREARQILLDVLESYQQDRIWSSEGELIVFIAPAINRTTILKMRISEELMLLATWLNSVDESILGTNGKL